MLVTRHGERRNVYTRDPEMANSNYKIAIGSQIKCLKGKERPGKSSTHTKWVHQCLTTPQVPVTRRKLMSLHYHPDYSDTRSSPKQIHPDRRLSLCLEQDIRGRQPTVNRRSRAKSKCENKPEGSLFQREKATALITINA